MKKILILTLCLVLCGCAGFQQVTQNVQEFVCNPPQNVVNLAVAADPFIQMGLAAGFPEALLAYEAITAILSNGMACATVEQVNALIALLSSQQAKKMRAAEKTPAFDVKPLLDWLAHEEK